MKIAVVQSSYIPWKGYFDLIDFVDAFVIYDIVQYTKNDWRNRNRLFVNGEPRWMTIPIARNSLDQTINETRVASKNWHTKHWRTIAQHYGNRPGFDVHATWLESLYQSNAERQRLTDINESFLREICSALEIDTPIHRAEAFRLPKDRVDRLVTLCEALGATEYVSGPAAKSYLDESRFQERGLSVSWFSYDGYTQYPQASAQFEHNVSVIALLLNTGLDACRGFRGQRS